VGFVLIVVFFNLIALIACPPDHSCRFEKVFARAKASPTRRFRDVDRRKKATVRMRLRGRNVEIYRCLAAVSYRRRGRARFDEIIYVGGHKFRSSFRRCRDYIGELDFEVNADSGAS
jgi:hypothetical protein